MKCGNENANAALFIAVIDEWKGKCNLPQSMNRLKLLLSFCIKVPHPFLSMTASCDSELVAEDDGNTVELELAASSKPPNTKSEPHQNANIPGIMVIWWKETINEKGGGKRRKFHSWLLVTENMITLHTLYMAVKASSDTLVSYARTVLMRHRSSHITTIAITPRRGGL
jgi:hypothetical protein